MLSNLNEIAVSTRDRYRDEFKPIEVLLSERFKEKFGNVLRKKGLTIDFTPYTATVTTTGNLKMYIPNQWFVAAAYTTEFIQHFLMYKEMLEKILDENYPTSREKKEIITTLKVNEDQQVIEAFRINVESQLKSQGFSPAEVKETASLIIRFATDYDWWFGNKTIDRGDSYVSPTLSLLEVVNASQGYIAEISYMYATNSALSSVVLEMISTDTESKISYESQMSDRIGSYESNQKKSRLQGGKNEIIYGAPGTGKSRYIEDTYGLDYNSMRVVFHPEYTAFDFMGTYKPVPLYRAKENGLYTIDGKNVGTGEPVIDYRFVPGPFLKCLVKAYLDPSAMYTLIIEEINRANAAAVFGEVFQLLDRDINGMSEYTIDPPQDVVDYLNSIDGLTPLIENGLRIPSNMNLVATMNSADQGVIPMDSAFKRRWGYKYIRINIDGALHEFASLKYGGREVFWGDLIRAINKKLSSLALSEDRLIGPYFIKPNELGSKVATDKLLLYLWDDVLRYNRINFFNSDVNLFSDLTEKFDEIDVFDLFSNNNTSKFFKRKLVNEDKEDSLNFDNASQEIDFDDAGLTS